MAVLIVKSVFPFQKLVSNFLRYFMSPEIYPNIYRKRYPKISLKTKLVLITLAIMVSPCHAAIADESLEDGVKAAYLYKFSSYVDWPSTAFASPTSPFTVCLLGSSDHFNNTLKKVIQGESVNGRKIVVNEVQALVKDTGCHILYIGISDSQRSAALLDNVRGSNVLTVSDNASRGIIGFTITNNRLRFNIDDAAAAENGLVISSRLLSLAINVKRRE